MLAAPPLGEVPPLVLVEGVFWEALVFSDSVVFVVITFSFAADNSLFNLLKVYMYQIYIDLKKWEIC